MYGPHINLLPSGLYRRLRNRTESVAHQCGADEGLAGLLCFTKHTAGRELHPAPKVSIRNYATKLEHAAS